MFYRPAVILHREQVFYISILLLVRLRVFRDDSIQFPKLGNDLMTVAVTKTNLKQSVEFAKKYVAERLLLPIDIETNFVSVE